MFFLRLLSIGPEQVGAVHSIKFCDIVGRLEVFVRRFELVEAIEDNMLEEQAIAAHDTFLLVLALNLLDPTPLKRISFTCPIYLLFAVVIDLCD